MEMEFLSLKDYAKKMNITYEAVRRQIQRYETELQGHIIIRNKTRYLDEYAVDFLNNKRRESPIIMYQMDLDEEIERLRKEKESLLIKVAAQANEIAELAKWQVNNIAVITNAEQQKLLIEQKERANQELHKEILNYRVEIGELATAKIAAEQNAENLRAFLTGAEERIDQLEVELSEQQKTVHEKEEQLQNERSEAEKERLKHQNQIEQLKTKHSQEIEQQRLENTQKVAVAADEWKNKSLFERIFKK